MLDRNEIDQILRNSKPSRGPYITLNDTLTEGELKKLRKAAKEYADKNNKKLSEINEKDMYLVAKKLDFKKFIFHDK